jgi:energy-coupling factor transport system substrate-specific component
MSISSVGRFLIYVLGTVLGIVAFFYPFFAPIEQRPGGAALSGGSRIPLLLTLVVGVCFLALLFEVQKSATGTKLVALLGVLVAINAMLRFAEVAIPGPAGFSPIFFLVTLTGYVFGPGFGFLMGAMTLLVSALITGGIGPWLPFQMLAASWIGMSAAAPRLLIKGVGREDTGLEVVILAFFSGVWGLCYGLLINLYFWPFIAGPDTMYWQAGISVAETVRRYLAFYATTSLIWDLMRLVGNVVMMAVLGRATLRVLRRFRRRVSFDYQPLSPKGGP